MGSSNKWHLGGPGSVKDFGSGFRVGGFSVLRAYSFRGCLQGIGPRICSVGWERLLKGSIMRL